MIKILTTILLFSTFLFANIGKISAVVGDAKITRGDTSVVVSIGTELEQKDIISTKANSKVQIIFNDRTLVTIGKNSALNIEEYLYDTNNSNNSKVKLNFFKGAFKSITGTIGKLNKNKFILKTKTAAIGIRGTIIIGNQQVIACTDGGISVHAGGVTVNVDKGELTIIDKENKATPAQKIENTDMSNLGEWFKPDQEKEEKNADTKEGTSQSSDATNQKEEVAQEETSEEETTQTEESELAEDEAIEQDTTQDDTTEEQESDTNSNDVIQEKIVLENELEEKELDIPEEADPVLMSGLFLTDTGASSTISYEKSIDEDTGGITLTPSVEGDTVITFTPTETSYTTFDGNDSIGDVELTIGGTSTTFTSYTDNLQEFFVLQDGSTLAAFGDKSTTTLTDNQIYRYDVFKSSIGRIKITTDTGDIISYTGIVPGDGDAIYINSASDDATYFDKSIYEDGLTSFAYGTSDNINYEAKNQAIENRNISYSSSFAQTFYGSENQGLTSFLEVESESLNYTNFATSFLNNEATDDAKTTGTYSLTGLGSFFQSNSGNSQAVTYENATINLSIDRTTGDISGSGITYQADLGTGAGNQDFYKSLLLENSYYINDDMFGIKLDEEGDSQINALVAIPDGGYDTNGDFVLFNANDNPMTSDDDSSWGYWSGTQVLDSENDISVDFSKYSTWVAGTEFDVNTNNISGAYTFNGKVLGAVNIADTEIAIDSINSSVNISFSFGSNDVITGGNISFSDVNGQSSWNLDLADYNSRTVGDTTFSGDIDDGAGTTASYSGKFFGTDSLKSIGGTFDATNPNGDTANGVFKATH